MRHHRGPGGCGCSQRDEKQMANQDAVHSNVQRSLGIGSRDQQGLHAPQQLHERLFHNHRIDFFSARTGCLRGSGPSGLELFEQLITRGRECCRIDGRPQQPPDPQCKQTCSGRHFDHRIRIARQRRLRPG